MQARLISGIAVALLLGGCATFQPPMQSDRPPAAIAATPFPFGNVPIALVLSGGSARGFAHVGVIKVLEAMGLKPDIIVGTSAGSGVGALYASGLTATQLEEAVAQMDSSVFTDFVLPGLGFLPGEMGFVRKRLNRRAQWRSSQFLTKPHPVCANARSQQIFARISYCMQRNA